MNKIWSFFLRILKLTFKIVLTIVHEQACWNNRSWIDQPSLQTAAACILSEPVRNRRLPSVWTLPRRRILDTASHPWEFPSTVATNKKCGNCRRSHRRAAYSPRYHLEYNCGRCTLQAGKRNKIINQLYSKDSESLKSRKRVSTILEFLKEHSFQRTKVRVEIKDRQDILCWRQNNKKEKSFFKSEKFPVIKKPVVYFVACNSELPDQIHRPASRLGFCFSILSPWWWTPPS